MYACRIRIRLLYRPHSIQKRCDGGQAMVLVGSAYFVGVFAALAAFGVFAALAAVGAPCGTLTYFDDTWKPSKCHGSPPASPPQCDTSCNWISNAATVNSDTAMWRTDTNGTKLQLYHMPVSNRCVALAAAGVQSIHLVGDSRTRDLAEALAVKIDTRKRARFSFEGSGPCQNHSYRYSHEVECAKVLPPTVKLCNNRLRFSYKACWRVSMKCLDSLEEGLPNRSDLLILSIGFHDLISRTVSPTLLASRFEVALQQRSCNEASVILTTAPLCPPHANSKPKFQSWESVNERIAVWNSVEARLAHSRCWGVVQAHALLRGKCTWSYDTVHYSSPQWPAGAAVALLGAADNGNRPPPEHWRLALSSLNAAVGLGANSSARHVPAQLVSEGPRTADALARRLARPLAGVEAVWFGGSVTAEGLIVKSTHALLQQALGTSTKLVTHNLGVPAAGPVFTSFCLDGLMASRGLQLHHMDVIFLEWAENDFEPRSESMASLAMRLVELPQRPAVIIYVHCGPRSWAQNCTLPAHINHPRIGLHVGALVVTNIGLHELAHEQLRAGLNFQNLTDFRDGVHPSRTGRAGLESASMIHQAMLASVRLGAVALSSRGAVTVAPPEANNATSRLYRACWTALGGPKERNLQPMRPLDPSWEFVSNRKETYANGKNGWESHDPGRCISFELGPSCVKQLAVFYLSSPRLALHLGRASLRLLPHSQCGNKTMRAQRMTLIDAYQPRSPHTAMGGPAIVQIPRYCHAPRLEVCTHVGSNTHAGRMNHSTFQVIAIGCDMAS